MSYIKKIEDDYNDGKISLNDIAKLRDEYNKKDAKEKLKLDNQYAKFTSPKILAENKKDDVQNEDSDINYYYLWLLSCVVFGFVFFAQQNSRGGFSDIIILDFFFLFLSMGFIPMIFVSLIGLPIKIFSKINTGKILFWSSIILGMANVLNGTFS